MAFYRHTYPEALALPLRTFWLMNTNIDRIQAQADLRSLSVANMAQAQEDSAREFRQRLVVETGTIVKLEADSPLHATRDEAGFAELKALSRKL